jgi:hypothetical protein
MSGTGSLLIRNLRKASDYDKARINQDDLLKIAIANDNNISNARRAYRQGEVPPLTPQQQYTPDEIQADVSKNYSDAITNLLSLGMRYEEARDIVTRLGADPTNLVILNNTFPSLKLDFLKRFDVKRVTATGFVDFFQKFREVFDETKGIADNSVLFNDKFDRIINNINDLRAILPTKDQIKSLRTLVQVGITSSRDRSDRRSAEQLRQIGDMLGALQRRLPDEAVFQRLAQLDPQAQFQQLAQLQNRFDNLPSRDKIQEVIDKVDRGELTTRALVDAVGQIVNSMKAGEEAQAISPPARAEAEVPIADVSGRLPAREIARLSYIPMGVDANVEGRVYDTIGMTNEGQGGHLRIAFNSTDAAPGNRSKGFNREELYDLVNASLPLQQVVRRFTGQDWNDQRTQVGKKRLIGMFVNSVEQKLGEAKSSGRRPSLKPPSASSSSDWTAFGEEDPQVTSVNVGKLFENEARNISRGSSKGSSSSVSPKESSSRRSRSPSSESNPRSPKPEGGRGVMVMGGRKPILIKKIGRGLEPVETPSHIQFGKYLLHANNMNKSVLSVHHKGGGRVQSIPVQTMSEDLRDFIVEVLQNKKASQKLFSRLPLSEQKLFEKMSKGAGVHHTLGLKPVKSDEDEKLEDRFEVLKGEWLAGNNSHELVRELRKIVIYFMEEGRLTKSQARELLLTIN